MAIWQDIEKTVRGFVAAGIFDRDGMIIDGHSVDENFHIEHAAAMFISLVDEADGAGATMGLGESAEVQLTFDEVIILLRRVSGSDRGLVVGLAANKESSPLGRVRMAMDILMQRLGAEQRPKIAAVG